MSEQKSFFSTLPGILTGLAALLTAVAGLIYALSETGLFGSRGKSQLQPAAAKPPQATAVMPTESVSAGVKKETTDGWAIIGRYKQGKFSDLKLLVRGDSPAIGRSYDAAADFRLIHKRPERDQAVITLGIVHRGEPVEVLDIESAPDPTEVRVWAKLRAAPHPVSERSRRLSNSLLARAGAG